MSHSPYRPTRHNFSKKTLDNIPFDKLYLAHKEHGALGSLEFYKAYDIKRHSNWIFPQALSYIAQHYPAHKDPRGLYSLQKTFAALGSSPFAQGIIQLLREDRLSFVVPKQLDTPYLSALVPLLLSAYKKHQNIKYSAWDLGAEEAIKWRTFLLSPTINSILDFDHLALEEKLIQAAETEGHEDLMAYLRHLRSTVPSKGDLKSYGLKLSGTPLEGAPKVVVHMLLQTWVAHPKVRCQYQILDPRALDNIPEPLETDEVFINTTDLPPWML